MGEGKQGPVRPIKNGEYYHELIQKNLYLVLLNMGSALKYFSYYLPEKEYANEDYFLDFPQARENADKLMKIGISSRRHAAKGETASDLAVKSALKLFEEHTLDRSVIDFVLFCTEQADHIVPATACIIQERLKLGRHCGALDYNLACSGFIYGVAIAKGLIESVGVNHVLLLNATTVTSTVNPRDGSCRYLFGDGAAATLISADTEQKIGAFVFGTDGARSDKIIIKDGAFRYPLSESSYLEREDEYGNRHADANLYMNGASIFNFGLKTVPQLVRDTLAKNNSSMEEMDLFVFHQANRFLIESIAARLAIPAEKVFNFMEHSGNTVSATIPIVLAEAVRSGRARTGSTILICGFGTGLSWGATVITL